jgi:endonuclease/exonuclease/phosphatase family metal-dependent hydrolase
MNMNRSERTTLVVAAFAAAALPVFACQGPAFDTCDGEACIQVGTLNIEWLGDRERTREDVAAIADLLTRELDLEAIAFQEIDTESEAWGWLSDALGAEGYRFVRGRTSASSQFVVLAYDEDELDVVPGSVQELDVATAFEWPGGECRIGGQRAPLAARFRAGEFEFWMVGLHLKSRSTRRGRLPAWCPDSIRISQTRALAAGLEDLVSASGEDDVLLVGDFNAFYDDPTLAPLHEMGFESMVAPGVRGPGSAGHSFVEGPRGLIDHVMIRLDRTAEAVPRSGFVYVIPPGRLEAYVARISDHAPVWASFRTGPEQREDPTRP